MSQQKPKFASDLVWLAMQYACPKCVDINNIIYLLDKTVRARDFSAASMVLGMLVGNLTSFPYYITLLTPHCEPKEGIVVGENVLKGLSSGQGVELNTPIVPGAETYVLLVVSDCGKYGNSKFCLQLSKFNVEGVGSILLPHESVVWVATPCIPVVEELAVKALELSMSGAPLSVSEIGEHDKEVEALEEAKEEELLKLIEEESEEGEKSE